MALNKCFLQVVLIVLDDPAPLQSHDCELGAWQPSHTYNSCSAPQSCDCRLWPSFQSQWGSQQKRSKVALVNLQHLEVPLLPYLTHACCLLMHLFRPCSSLAILYHAHLPLVHLQELPVICSSQPKPCNTYAFLSCIFLCPAAATILVPCQLPMHPCMSSFTWYQPFTCQLAL